MKCSLTRIIRRLASLLLLSSGIGARFAHAQATLPGTILWPGEVAVVGYTATGPAPDFAFVPLVALAPGTQLRLTNNGWQAVGSFRPGETTITYTVPAAGVVKGKVITYSANKTSFSGPLPLAATGDQLLIYQGPDLTPTFVAALNYGPGGFTDATSAATTALPPGLTLGNSALALPTQPTGYYAGATRAGLPVDLRAARIRAGPVGGRGELAHYRLHRLRGPRARCPGAGRAQRLLPVRRWGKLGAPLWHTRQYSALGFYWYPER